MLYSVKAFDRPLMLKLVKTIFSVEREYMKDDEIDHSYKNIGAVNGLSDSRTKPVKKVMALDHMCNLVKPSFISPFMFGSNLVMYSIAQSEMAVNIYGKLHHGGQYTTMTSWSDGLAMEIQDPYFAGGGPTYSH